MFYSCSPLSDEETDRDKNTHLNESAGCENSVASTPVLHQMAKNENVFCCSHRSLISSHTLVFICVN